jgi:hypothetical protein
MNYETYPWIESTGDLTTFHFVSEGPKGYINKVIAFHPMEDPTVFNLAFGDAHPNGHVDDSIVTDNGDRDKILATVAAAVNVFTKSYPDYWVFFTGRTESRTRLYRMAVNKHLLELRQLYEIYTIINGQPVPFYRHLAVNSFLIRRKI